MVVDVVVPDEVVQTFNEFKSAVERDGARFSVSFNFGPQQISTLTIERALELFVACFGDFIERHYELYKQKPVVTIRNVSETPGVAAILQKIEQAKAASRKGESL